MLMQPALFKSRTQTPITELNTATDDPDETSTDDDYCFTKNDSL